MEKAERYDWAPPGDSGKQTSIKIGDLKLDHNYQRQEVSHYNTLAIARGFCWGSFGSLVVMKRDSGDMYVVDGQQRLLAARKRGDINYVPCIVFKSEGRNHEAKAFIALNVNRKNVSAVTKFKAAVMAKQLPEKEIADWLESRSLFVDGHQDGKHLSFPTVLINTWRIDVDSAKKAISVQKSMVMDTPMHSSFHKGLFYLEHGGIDTAPHVEKIMRCGGLTGVLKAIKTYQLETGLGTTLRVCGCAILGIINHKRKAHKIAVPEFGLANNEENDDGRNQNTEG